MEEAKADDLFRLFTKVDAAAKQKKGLGYGSTGGFDSLSVKTENKTKQDMVKPSFQSTFVREGEAVNQCELTASQSAAIARQKEGDSALARRSAAAEVARRLAEKAAEIKRSQRRSPSPHIHADSAARGGRTSNRSRSRSRERSSGDTRHGRQRSRSRHSARDQDRENSKVRYDISSGRNEHRSEKDRAKSIGIDGGHRSTRHDTSDKCAKSQRGFQDHQGNGKARSFKADMDYPRLVPGWDLMSPAEQLKARVRLSLQQAGASSLDRDEEEREEAIRDAEQEGRMASVEHGARRPWTRFVFDHCAPLDEEGARPSLAFLEERRVEGIDDCVNGDEEAEATGRGGVGAINGLSFRTSGQVAAQKQRDTDHDAAIFGGAIGRLTGKGAAANKPDDTSHGSIHLPAVTAASRSINGHGNPTSSSVMALYTEMGEDAPVIVTEEELLGAQLRTARRENNEDLKSSPIKPTTTSAASEEIKEKQKTMTWRERALLARAGKTA